MSLEKPNCYECRHLYVCSFCNSIQDVIIRHIKWVDTDIEWQKIYVAVAKACTLYAKCDEKERNTK